MATYGLYSKIDPTSLNVAVDSLGIYVSSTKTDLTSLKNGLTDTVWKASAKNTLITAFNTMDSTVYNDIANYMSTLKTISGYIANYKNAETNANTYKGYLANVTNNTPQASINEWTRLLAQYEGIMDDCESQINSLK